MSIIQSVDTMLTIISPSCTAIVQVVFDVFDRYINPDFIGSAKTDRRSTAGTMQVFHVSDGRSIPDWKSFCQPARTNNLRRVCGENFNSRSAFEGTPNCNLSWNVS